MEINGERIMIEGKILRIAKPHAWPQQEWFEDVENPEVLIGALQKTKHCPDILTFWQRLPDTQTKYSYAMELDSIAALPIKSYSYWWEKQIDRTARNKARKAEKKGVIVKPATFDDRFIQGMTSIFNETPVRQGRRYLHYGKDFETVKRELLAATWRLIMRFWPKLSNAARRKGSHILFMPTGSRTASAILNEAMVSKNLIFPGISYRLRKKENWP